MNNIVKIESDTLEVKINLIGGTFTSIIDKRTGEELQFQGDERSWKDQDMVIFPFIGGMPDAKYTVNGKEFTMKRHGFCRHEPFYFVEQSENRAVIKFVSNDKTKEIYPYDFTLYLIYEVKGKNVSLSYKVVNEGNEDMYFYLGGHLALILDGTDEEGGAEDTKGNFITLDKEATTLYGLGETFINRTEKCSIKSFEVDKDFMRKHRTLIVETGGEGKLTLKRKNGREFEFRYGSPVLGVWSMEDNGKYVCIEPWWGICGEENGKTEISEKKWINKVEAGKEFNCGYSFTVK